MNDIKTKWEDKMEYLDMWYKDSPAAVTRADCFFNDLECHYSGNVYIGNKCVGDYMTGDYEQLRRWFPQLTERKN